MIGHHALGTEAAIFAAVWISTVATPFELHSGGGLARTSPPSPAASARSRRSGAETDKSAVSRISKSADRRHFHALPTWKSATQQVWKPALRSFQKVSNFASIAAPVGRSRREENSTSQASGMRRANGVMECWSLEPITPTLHYSNHPFIGRL